MTTILKISNLTKEYENVVALNDVSLEIEKGTIFGLLGPNGAGKTSLIRILTGISIPDKGSFTLENTENKDFDSLSRMIGYLPEERGLYNDMKVIEQLEFFGQIKGLNIKEAREKIDYYCERMGIKDWYQKKAKELSKGMQQMVQFVSTIFFEPSLIILDEPFTGLDPINSNKMIQEIHELQKKGITIIFSTHRLEQVEEICENIALINKGKVILKGKISDIKNDFKKHKFRVILGTKGYRCLQFVESRQDACVPSFEILENKDNEMIIRSLDPNTPTNTIIKSLMEEVEIQSFIEIYPSLSEIFIELVEKSSDKDTDSSRSANLRLACEDDINNENELNQSEIGATDINQSEIGATDINQSEIGATKSKKTIKRLVLIVLILIFIIYRFVIKH